VLTGENRSGKEFYYVPEPIKRLEWSLTHVKRQLIALIGLQGTGKTSALNYIFTSLNNQKMKTAYIKWSGDWFTNLIDAYDDIAEAVNEQIEINIRDQLESYGSQHKTHPVLKHVPTADDLDDYGFKRLMTETPYDLFLPKGKIEEIKKETVWKCLAEHDVILIDLPDYTKIDKRLMAKHLLEVQQLWGKVGANPNIVVAIQKELFSGHFFFGKMDKVELTPLKPEELIFVFQKQFPNCNLITDSALLLLGELSRGVFRRFLKYLKLTCETFAVSEQKPPIDVEHVNKAVTVQQLMDDMELELYDIFRDANQRQQAVKLLNHLRTTPLNQKDIAEFLNVSEPTAAKIISRLFAYRYIDKQRGEGKEWIITLRT
jgi:predicted XRE-type DNA-binding protein